MILAQRVHEIYSSETVGCDNKAIDRLGNFDNCQPETVSEVISSTVNQDVGMDVCAHFGDSRLKQSEASFPALFRMSIA